MPLAQQTIRTAIKGLITERQELVFPEDASVDELNCDLRIDGTRQRRKGLEFETSNTPTSFTVTDDQLINTQTWLNVGGIPNLEFLVLQVANILYFFDKSVDPTEEKSFTVDLNSFSASNGVSITESRFQGSSLDGVFVIVHPGCEVFTVEYDLDTDNITTLQITLQVRDFDWQGDTDTYFVTEPTPVSIERQYDTLNSGWDTEAVPDPLDAFIANQSAYPPLTHAWFTGLIGVTPSFNVSSFINVYAGTTLTANGHYILDFFSKDRESIVAGMGVERELSRFTTVEAFAGRFWYAGLESEENGGKILFSKVIEGNTDYGRAYQENDPTAEDISDLLDSDGGVINIPEAYGIRKLFVYGSSLLVFAENGVWVIQGVDQVFKATEFSVSKVSNMGILTEESFVDAEGNPFWWSKYGIHSIARTQVSESPQESNISETTIQTFWDSIPVQNKLKVRSVFDPFNKKIIWMYPSSGETVSNKHNQLLILDINIEAFIPWSISDQASSTHYVVGIAFFDNVGTTIVAENVTVSGGNVTVSGSIVTVDNIPTQNERDTLVKYIVRNGTTDTLTFATFTNTGFLDWGDTNYVSFVELGYASFENLTTFKSPMVVTTYFKMTESGFSDNGDGSYSLLTPSSCIMKVFWDFRNTESSSQQVYRLKRMPVVDTGNLNSFNYGSSVLINRTRIKGRGRVMNLKFLSEQGKDFKLLGYEFIGVTHDRL